jgi:hypothetical protein
VGGGEEREKKEGKKERKKEEGTKERKYEKEERTRTSTENGERRRARMGY